MIEFKVFLEQHNFVYPLAAAVISVYAQFICGMLCILGLFIRPAAIVMMLNLIVALLTVHLGTTFFDSFQALIMLFGPIFFLFNGAGKLSLDNWLVTRQRSNR